jgi:hydrogenase maturation protease
MKPLLIIGLGNTLMGDDGVGCAVVERLAADPRLPDYAEAVNGGSDLLRCAGWMEGRSRVVVIDALQDGGDPGNVLVLEGAGGLDEGQSHAHHLSAVQSIRLLQMAAPTPFTLLGISIQSVKAGSGLSPMLAGQMPAILDRVLRELTWSSSM